MTRIAIVTAGVLPVPAVLGGAVETLVDALVHENEHQKQLIIDVFGVDVEEARLEAEASLRTRHVFVRANAWADRLFHRVDRIHRKLLGGRGLLKTPYLRRVIGAMRGSAYDVIVIENRPSFVLPLARRYPGKVVLHLHNNTLNSKTPRARKVAGACAAVIVVSNFIRGRVLTACPDLGPRVAVLRNCIDVPYFAHSLEPGTRSQFRDTHGISDDDVVVLFAGRVDPAKGVRELVEAIESIDDSSIKLLVVGAAWYASSTETTYSRELAGMARDLGDRVLFTGYLPHSRMPDAYAVADIAVVPSVWDEPAGLVVVEAMAAGLPLIVTDSGGIPEYCSDECAIILPRDDQLVLNLARAIQTLASNIDLRRVMGGKGRGRAALFDRPQYFRDFVRILEDLPREP